MTIYTANNFLGEVDYPVTINKNVYKLENSIEKLSPEVQPNPTAPEKPKESTPESIIADGAASLINL